MSIDRRKMILFLASVGGFYILILGITADIAQIFSLKYGFQLLILLFIVAMIYKGWHFVQSYLRHYRTMKIKLDEARNFIMRSAGTNSSNVLICARTLWLFQRPDQYAHVSKFQADDHLILDVRQVSLEPVNLLGMHFRIMSSNGERAKGIVKSCDPAQACIELYEQTEQPDIGDLAIPIVPSSVTDLERLLGSILFLISE